MNFLINYLNGRNCGYFTARAVSFMEQKTKHVFDSVNVLPKLMNLSQIVTVDKVTYI